MAKRILITGGAGFIGAHLAEELLAHGYSVRALDCLSPQVHPGGKAPDFLPPEVELVIGELQNRETVRLALRNVDAVIHLAAKVGVGQSMYQIAEYTAANNAGTAVLMEAIIESPVERLIVASSMSVYGEGMYRNCYCGLVAGGERRKNDLKTRTWELLDPDGSMLIPVPTPESKPPALASIYAVSKFHQEQMCLVLGRAYRIPTIALRLFNVYGPRQALSNPYTGVLAIFGAQLLNNRAPTVFEDGLQRRDFVHVRDVVAAFRLALDTPRAHYEAINIGSGSSLTVRTAAENLAKALGKEKIGPEITGRHRAGDVRHCFADITRATELLGYKPQINFDTGISEFGSWLEKQIAEDHAPEAEAELRSRGLTA